MPTRQTKASLSPARRCLLELLQRMNFGRLESLEICNGEPVLDPLPRRQFEIKFSGENGPRPELNSPDFLPADIRIEARRASGIPLTPTNLRMLKPLFEKK